jgi:DtxR family Mn-dependent transcriptional regulator
MKHDEFRTVRGYELLNQNKNQLTSAMEDYLEMIYRNIGREGYMRINTLSELLNVKPSSATRMVQKLKELGLICYEKYGIIFLTDDGKEYGRFLLERHNIVEKFLKSLGIKENLLTETELVEHNISKNTMERINKLNQILEAYPEIIGEFETFNNQVNGRS